MLKLIGIVVLFYLVKYIMDSIEETYSIMQNPEVSCD